MNFMQETESDVSIQANCSSSRIYELGYLLVPTIEQDNLSVHYGNLKELILSLAGEVISDEMPRMVTLAYSMPKVVSNVRNEFNTSYFGWIKFTMDSKKVLQLKKRLDLDSNFVRFLILKTVKENTVAAKRFMRGEMYRRPTRKSPESEITLPINNEEIDKEIDALVAI